MGLVAIGSLIGVMPWGWDAFGPLRWLVVSAAGFAAIALGVGRGIEFDRITKAWAGLVGLMILATIVGTVRAPELYAWIGTPDRHFGVLTWFLCGGLFITARTAASDLRDLVVQIVVVSGGLAGVYSIAEYFDLAPVDVTFANDRLGGPFGQPALLGAAMVALVPLAIGLSAEESRTTPARLIYASSAAAMMFGLLGSQARAAWAAAIIAVALIIRLANRRSVAASAVVIAGIAALTPVGSRATSLFDRNGVVAGRTDEWQVALRAIADQPLFGYAPEGYRTVFGRHVDVEYVIDHGRTVITDRAHNGILDVAVSGGVPAAVLYVVVLGLLAVALWPQVRSGQPAQVGLAVGVVAYFVQQLFLFPVAELDPMAWMLAGLAIAPGSDPVDSARPTDRQSTRQTIRVPRIVAIGIAQVAVIAVMFGALNMAADYRTQQAVATSGDSVDQQATALDHIGQARKLRGDSIRYDFIASRLWADADSFAGSTEQALQASVSLIDDGLRVAPNDPALLGERSRRLLDLAAETGSPADLARATTSLEALVMRDPNHPEHRLRLGVAYAMAANLEQAEAEFRFVLMLAPDNAPAQQNLARVLAS